MMQAFINSFFVDEEESSVSPLSAGFLYGYGVFETIKVYKKTAIFLEQHYQRLKDSLLLINQTLDYSFQDIADICEKLIDKNFIDNGFLKIVCTRSKTTKTDIFIYTGTKNYLNEYKNGFKLCLASSKRNEFSKLCFIKSISYSENIIQKEIAYKQGFDEAIFLNTRDVVCEGCISNIFWVKKGVVFTPSIECGLLAGIARKKTLELCKKMGIQTIEGHFCLNDIYNADEVFITNSLMDIMPVSVFEKKHFIINDLVFVHELMYKYRLSYYSY